MRHRSRLSDAVDGAVDLYTPKFMGGRYPPACLGRFHALGGRPTGRSYEDFTSAFSQINHAIVQNWNGSGTWVNVNTAGSIPEPVTGRAASHKKRPPLRANGTTA